MPDPGEHSAPPTRAEVEALAQRLSAVERALLLGPQTTCRSCRQTVPTGRFCAHCGAPMGTPAAPAPAHPAKPAQPSIVSDAPPRTAPPPAAPPVRPAARPTAASLESALGQRLAPRAGAILVFLGIVFFLGVAIQRGWIGPLAQLGIAVATGSALIGGGAFLTMRRGYGTYPQILEATGASVLYITAFVAHALPYYERATGLTEVGSGLLMATVSVGTVALALHRDARTIAGLGYGLAFLTALLGADPLPTLTISYVALLGTSLAVLVARKGWSLEGTLGTFATGLLLLWLAAEAEGTSDPGPILVASLSLLPAGAFLWLTARRPTEDGTSVQLNALITLATFAWIVGVTQTVTTTRTSDGLLILAWALLALGHAILTARAHAGAAAVGASGAAAVILWVIGAPLAWSDWNQAQLLTTSSYALAALGVALASLSLRPAARRGPGYAALALAGAAAIHAIGWQNMLHPPWEPARGTIGPIEAYATLALLAAPLIALTLLRATDSRIATAAFWLAALFGTIWGFALFTAPLATTLWLVLLAAGLLAIGTFAPSLTTPASATVTRLAIGIIALATLKTITLDARYPGIVLDPLPGTIEALIVAGTLLALQRFVATKTLLPTAERQIADASLIGASALVLANAILVHATGPWSSILLGVLGVGYLAAGLARRDLPLYRYTGFGLLGFVIIRVFTIDMRETDLAIRALVFAVLGAILLGVGYVYARNARTARPPPPPAPPRPPP